MLKLSEIFSGIVKLIPFMLATTIYFADIVPPHTEATHAFIKCLPIVCLIIFIGLCSMDMAEGVSWYAKVIIVGLVFCGIGDVLLVWPDLFELGVLAFAMGHVCYIVAFGFEPLAWKLGSIMGACFTGGLVYLSHNIEETLQLIGVILYTYIILTMVWRAWARLTTKENWSWSKLLTALGATIFAISDLLLALNKFIVDITYSRELVMSTYYFAQLLIALSVLEPRSPTKQIIVCCWKVRSNSVKLIPFFLSIVVHFFGFIPHNDKLLLAFTECLPLACLLFFVSLYALDIKGEVCIDVENPCLQYIVKNKYYCYSYKAYCRMIALGLFCFGIGDALSIWPLTYEYSLVAYIAGHIHYTLGFGFLPRAWLMGLFFYIVCLSGTAFFVINLPAWDMIMVSIYAFFLTTLLWRTWAPLEDKKNWTRGKIATIVGVMMFVLSDIILAIVKYKVNIQQYVKEATTIMYYLGQLLITLSIIEPHFPPLDMDSKFV
ncbi:putative YhhN family [Trypoxylus dichotomus]